jgi:3'-phosphoadenosine 5'-phosphosulfate sulfotransferase (PAPS reductase)/FAD synthetase
VKLRLHHALERVERAKQTIEDKRASSLKAIQQLEKDYIVMGKERSEADKRIAERRAQAEDLQRQVSPLPDITDCPLPVTELLSFSDGRSPEAE